MADNDIKTDMTQVDDSQADNNQTNDSPVNTAKQSNPDFMTDTVAFIKETQKNTVDSNDTNSDDDNPGVTPDAVQDATLTSLAGTDIPDAFSDAAEAMGMTPSEIVAFGDSHTNEELIELIPYLQEKIGDTQTDDKIIKQDDKIIKQDDKINKGNDNKTIDTELETRIAEKIARQLEEKFGVSLEEIEKFKVHQKEQAEAQTAATVSKIFDETYKEFPVFGKTDELPKFTSGRMAGQWIPTSPAMKARLEVLRFADAFMGKGANIDNAMVNALATYKGLHLEKELERKQVRDLKRHETRLSGARIGRETKRKYVDTREEMINEIKQLQRASGGD